MPDYASRKLLWPGLVAKHAGAIKHSCDWATLAQISQGYTSGQIDLVVRSMLTERRRSQLAEGGPGSELTLHDILAWLSLVRPVSLEADEALRKFTERMPARAALAAAAAPTAAAPTGTQGAAKKATKKKK